MAHDLDFIAHDDTATGGLWTTPAWKDGFNFHTPEDSMGASLAMVKWLPDADCANCKQAERDATHSTCGRYHLLDKSTGGQYFGANPILPATCSPKQIARQIGWMQSILHAMEKWTGGWWSYITEGNQAYSTLYNAMDKSGGYSIWKPNFIDVVQFPVVSASGYGVTINTAYPNEDPRNCFWGAPLQPGDGVMFIGNNCAAYYVSQIITITSIAQGITIARPSTLTLGIDKDIATPLTTASPGDSWSAAALIFREYHYPANWDNLESPDYFYGERMVFSKEKPVGGWGADVNGIVLKNSIGGNTSVAVPYTYPNGNKTFSCRKRIGDIWSDLDATTVAAELPRAALYVDGRKKFATSAISIHAAFRADVAAGLSNSDFTCDTAGAVDFSGITKVDNRHWAVVATVQDTGTSPQVLTIRLTAGAAEDAFYRPTDPAMIELVFDNTGATPIITSAESGTTALKGIPIQIEFQDAAGSRVEVFGFTAADVTLSANAALVDFGGMNGLYNAELVSIDASDGALTVDIEEGACQDGAGNDCAAADQFAITFNSEQTAEFYLDYAPDPALYSSVTGAVAGSVSEIPCSGVFHAIGIDTSTLAESDFVCNNCRIKTGTLSVAAGAFSFTLEPFVVTIDAATEASTVTSSVYGAMSVQLPAGVCASEEVTLEIPPFGDYGGIANLASNLLSFTYYLVGPITSIRDVSTLVGKSVSLVEAVFQVWFSQPIVESDLAAGIYITSGANIIGPKNIEGNERAWGFSLIATDAGAMEFSVLANTFHDLAGQANDGPVSAAWVVSAETPGESLPTARRLFVTHDLLDRNHETAVTTLYLGSTVNSVLGFADILSDADAIEVSYFAKCLRSEYTKRPKIVGTKRCYFCRPDKTGTWGVEGPDGQSWRWYCSLKHYAPTGLAHFGAQCYQMNTCNRFAAITPDMFDLFFMSGPNLNHALQQLWTGNPGGLYKAVPGSSSYRDRYWQRADHSSIHSLLTPSESLRTYPVYSPEYYPMGCGAYGLLDRTDAVPWIQGLANRIYTPPFVIDPGWTHPTVGFGGSAAPEAGVLPRAIEGWDTGKTDYDLGALTNTTDPTNEIRRGYNDTGWQNGLDQEWPTEDDWGQLEHVRRNNGNETHNHTIIANLNPLLDTVQKRMNGEFQFGWFDANLQVTDEASAVYGAIARVKPYPHSPGHTWATAANGGVPPDNSPIALPINDHDPSRYMGLGYGQVQAISLIAPQTYKITCERATWFGIYYGIGDSEGPKFIAVYYKGGGNISGLPENARGNHYWDNSKGRLVGTGQFKGARAGQNVCFFGATVPLAQITDDLDTNPGFPQRFTISQVIPFGGDRLSWFSNAAYDDDDLAYYSVHIAACLHRSWNETNWLSRPDVLVVKDPQGILASWISAGYVAVGSTFYVDNGASPFHHGMDYGLTWHSTAYRTRAWDDLGSGAVNVNHVSGLFGITKAAALSLKAYGDRFCLRCYSPKGRMSYTPMVSANAINRTMLAIQSIETVSTSLVIAADATIVSEGYYQELTRYAGEWAYGSNIDGPDPRLSPGASDAAYTLSNNPCSLPWPADPDGDPAYPCFNGTEATTSGSAMSPEDAAYGGDGINCIVRRVSYPESTAFSWSPGFAPPGYINVDYHRRELTFNDSLRFSRIAFLDRCPDGIDIVSAWAKFSGTAVTHSEWFECAASLRFPFSFPGGFIDPAHEIWIVEGARAMVSWGADYPEPVPADWLPYGVTDYTVMDTGGMSVPIRAWALLSTGDIVSCGNCAGSITLIPTGGTPTASWCDMTAVARAYLTLRRTRTLVGIAFSIGHTSSDPTFEAEGQFDVGEVYGTPYERNQPPFGAYCFTGGQGYKIPCYSTSGGDVTLTEGPYIKFKITSATRLQGPVPGNIVHLPNFA